MTNWVDSKHSVNSVNSHVDNTEPSQCSMHEGVETRHGVPTATCVVCGKTKSTDEFYKKDRKKKRLDTTCKSCRIIGQRERILGITDKEYWTLYHKQDGRCGICRRRMYSKRYKRFSVDHDHETGRIRGLLCHNCNRALGMFRDDPTTLLRAVEWVKI